LTRKAFEVYLLDGTGFRVLRRVLKSRPRFYLTEQRRDSYENS
jgi:hypothetical protein